jgi:hypothetical protein
MISGGTFAPVVPRPSGSDPQPDTLQPKDRARTCPVKEKPGHWLVTKAPENLPVVVLNVKLGAA